MTSNYGNSFCAACSAASEALLRCIATVCLGCILVISYDAAVIGITVWLHTLVGTGSLAISFCPAIQIEVNLR